MEKDTFQKNVERILGEISTNILNELKKTFKNSYIETKNDVYGIYQIDCSLNNKAAFQIVINFNYEIKDSIVIKQVIINYFEKEGYEKQKIIINAIEGYFQLPKNKLKQNFHFR